MKTLEDTIEYINDLKGQLTAQHVFLLAIARSVQPADLRWLREVHQAEVELARTELLNARISEHVLHAFERDVQATTANLDRLLMPENLPPTRQG